MLAAKTLSLASPLPGETDLKDTLSTALDLENGQLARLPAAGRSGRRSDGLVEYSASSLKNVLVEAQLATSKSRSFVPSTAILRRHWQRKSSLEEVILELFYGNISVAKANEIARLLWGEGASTALVSAHAPRITKRIQSWLERKISEPQIYVFLHSLNVKQKIGGENRTTNLFAAIGIRSGGTREVLGVMNTVGARSEGWTQLLSNLKRRGLHGTTLFIGENELAALAAVRAHFPKALYQGNLIRLERDVLSKVRPAMLHWVMNALEVIRMSIAQKTAAAELTTLATRLVQDGASEAATFLQAAADFQFTFYHFPRSHWPRLHDFEPMRRILCEFREWIRIIGPVSDDHALTLLAAARLRSTARLSWSRRRYIKF